MSDSPGSSSYTDPFYDRLDAIFSWLGRRWLIVAAVIVVAVGLTISLRYSWAANPDAESAAALHKARVQGVDALRDLVDAEAFTAEARARAALDVAQYHLSEGSLDSAERLARRAVELANASPIDGLRAATAMSLAGILEEAGQLVAARDQYLAVVQRTRGIHPAYAISSDVASAILAARIADSESDVEAAAALRLEALRVLHDYAERSTDDGSIAIIAAATWRYFDLRRNFPEQARQLDIELGLISVDEDALEAAVDSDPMADDDEAPAESGEE